MNRKHAYKVRIRTQARPQFNFEFTTSRLPTRRVLYRAIRELHDKLVTIVDPEIRLANRLCLSEVVKYSTYDYKDVLKDSGFIDQCSGVAETVIGQITIWRKEVYS